MRLRIGWAGAILLAAVLPVAAEQAPRSRCRPSGSRSTSGWSTSRRWSSTRRASGSAGSRRRTSGCWWTARRCRSSTSPRSRRGRPRPARSESAGAPVAAGEEVGRNYLIYIDDSFSVANIRDEALAKLERDLTLLQPADRMAVLAFDGSRIDVLSGWTGDAAALAAALERARRRPALGAQQLSQQRALQVRHRTGSSACDGLEGDQIAAFQEMTRRTGSARRRAPSSAGRRRPPPPRCAGSRPRRGARSCCCSPAPGR